MTNTRLTEPTAVLLTNAKVRMTISSAMVKAVDNSSWPPPFQVDKLHSGTQGRILYE